MSNDKPRQFWITGNGIVFNFKPTPEMEVKTFTHVVELAPIIQELKAARDNFIDVRGSTSRDFDAIISLAVARLDKFIQQLEGKT